MAVAVFLDGQQHPYCYTSDLNKQINDPIETP